MVARLPQGPGGRPPWQSGNRRYALIFLVAAVLIVSLYAWNKQKVDARNREEVGQERLCEVRQELKIECEEK